MKRILVIVLAFAVNYIYAQNVVVDGANKVVIDGTNKVITSEATLPYTTNLKFDFEYDKRITLNGSTVSQWQDLSINGYVLSQSTASNQPTYGATTGLYFDGNDYLSALSAISLGSSWTLFIVAKNTDGVFSYCLGTGSGGGLYISSLRLGVYDGVHEASYTFFDSNYKLGAIYKNRLYKNGSYVNPTLSGTMTSFALQYLGVRTAASLYFTGYIKAVVGYTEELSDVNRALVESYLTTKFSIP